MMEYSLSQSNTDFIQSFAGTVKLGYNDHGYNEFTFITNEKNCAFWSQMTTYYINFHGYNESRL